MTQFHFSPRRYLRTVRRAVPDYEHLQEEVVRASAGLVVRNALDLGTGTGETARRVLEVHGGARITCVDQSADLLALARRALPAGQVNFRVADIGGYLPVGPFDLITSALAIHHLDEVGKQHLFARVAASLAPGGIFAMADVVLPEDPAQASTPLHGRYDRPSRLADQLAWMRRCGLEPVVRWSERDLAVVVAAGRLPGRTV